MFKSHHFLLFLISTSSHTRAAIHDEDYLNKNGPFGLITFEKNDTYVDWVRVPENSFLQWTSTLKIWRTVRLIAPWFVLESRDDDLAMAVFHRVGPSVFGLRGISSRLYYSWFSYQFEWSIRLLRRNEARGWRFIFQCDCSDERATTGSATSTETSSATRTRCSARETRSSSTSVSNHPKFDSTTTTTHTESILIETNDEIIESDYHQ